MQCTNCSYYDKACGVKPKKKSVSIEIEVESESSPEMEMIREICMVLGMEDRCPFYEEIEIEQPTMQMNSIKLDWSVGII